MHNSSIQYFPLRGNQETESCVCIVQSFSTAGHPLWRSYSAYVVPYLHTWQTIADQNRP